MLNARIAMAAVVGLLVGPCVSTDSSADELTNPAAPRAPERIELPAEKPQVEQTNYWRNARPLKAAESPAAQASDLRPVPPDPAPLSLPSWLLPESESLQQLEPPEPPGQAVMIDDHEPEVSADEVIELAMAKVQLAPSRSAALLVVARELAVDAKNVGDFGDVIDQCHRALDAGPERTTADSLAKLGAWAYNRRGELLVEKGDEHSAFEDFQEAIQLDPNNWAALHNRGVTLARYNKRADALSDFNRVVDLAPSFAIARYNRGELLSQMGRWREAVQDYTVAMQTMPDEASLYTARGVVLNELGERSEAATDFNRAIRLDPNSAQAYVGRGNVFAAERMYEQAVGDFQRALVLDPSSATAYRSTAWILATCPIEQFRDGQKALAAADRLAQLRGHDDPMVLDILAAAHAAGGDFTRAITFEQQAIVLEDDANLKQQYLHRLGLYRSGQAFRTE
ncbi:tetratricopeptide repeat protein [Aeoliella straminimaris]|nr:tetratricopeptide repeat protein [Aeoliella straminimaris]